MILPIPVTQFRYKKMSVTLISRQKNATLGKCVGARIEEHSIFELLSSLIAAYIPHIHSIKYYTAHITVPQGNNQTIYVSC